MKRVKKILYLLAITTAISLLVFMGTAIIQGVLFLAVEKLQIDISEDIIYHISGSSGVAIAGIVCAVYVKKKGLVQKIGLIEPLR